MELELIASGQEKPVKAQNAPKSFSDLRPSKNLTPVLALPKKPTKVFTECYKTRGNCFNS